MITGKYSALQGFALFIWLISAIVVLTYCLLNADIFCKTAGIISTLFTIITIGGLYKFFNRR